MLDFNFDSIIELVETFPTEPHCYRYLESIVWKDGIHCPHCGNKHKFWILKDQKTYKCSICRKRFNVKYGTFFEETRLSLKKWFIAIFLLITHSKGISSVQLAKDLKITQKTAWFVAHRIRYATQNFRLDTDKLNNTVEVDETYIGGKESNKHKSKKVKGTQGRSLKTKTAVFGAVQRAIKDEDGNKITPAKVIAYKVDSVNSDSLDREVLDNIEKGCNIMSDEWQGYKGLKYNFRHEFIQHNKGEYVNGEVHTNTIEGYWSLFKRMFIGIYHVISKDHINKYLDALTFRYNNIGENAKSLFDTFLSKSYGRLSYEMLTVKE